MTERVSKHEQREKQLLDLLCEELLARLKDPSRAADMSAAEMEVVRKLSNDAGITLSSIKSGEWGNTVKDIVEDLDSKLPVSFNEEDFPDTGEVVSG